MTTWPPLTLAINYLEQQRGLGSSLNTIYMCIVNNDPWRYLCDLEPLQNIASSYIWMVFSTWPWIIKFSLRLKGFYIVPAPQPIGTVLTSVYPPSHCYDPAGMLSCSGPGIFMVSIMTPRYYRWLVPLLGLFWCLLWLWWWGD